MPLVSTRPAAPDLRAAAGHKRVLSLAGPLLLAGISTPVMTLLETAAVGHLPESKALGAVAVGTMIFNTVYWAFSFLRFSTNGLAAQAVGAGRAEEMRAVLGRAGLIAVSVGVALAALSSPIRAAAFALVPASPDVRRLTETYVAIRILGAPATLGCYVLFGWFTGIARPGLAMGLELFRGCLSAALIGVLVVGLKWGVEGVAVASVAAEWSAALAAVFVASKVLKESPAPWPLRAIFDLGAVKRLFLLNGDLFVRTVCLLFVFGAFTAEGARFGDDTLAANAVLMNLYLVVGYALGAFGQVATTLIGTAVGAGDRTTLERAARLTSGWALGVAAASGVIVGLSGGALVRVLTGVEAVRAIAGVFLPYAAVMPLMSVLSFQFEGIAVGLLRTAAVRNVLLGALAVFLVANRTLVPAFGNHGLWIAFGVTMAARSTGFVFSLRAIKRAAAGAD